MSKPNREPIAKVDTAWLRMEQPTNLMMITGVIVFDEAVDFEHLKQVIRNRFLAFPRFRHKAVSRSRGCYWEEDEDFEITSHIRRTALPGAADKTELEELVSELASTPLDKSKPLWQFHLVENYAEGPALIARIHHCYADGMALVQVLLSLTESDAAASNAPVEPRRWKRWQAAESNIFRRLVEPARDGLDAVGHYGMRMFEEAVATLRDPQLATRYANEVGEIAAELSHALLLPDDSPSRFRGRLGVRKRVAWAPPVVLEEVKAVGAALGCTVNDVLIAVLTGALHQYLIEHGDDPAGLSMRATIPVNLRPLEHASDLGNHFGLVFLDLPVDENNPLARLYTVRDNMAALKASKQAAVSLGLLAVLGVAPESLQKPALEFLSRKASAVLTNVPGPASPLYMAGARLRELMFWVPQTGSIGMGVSIISYNGRVYCGLITDNRLVPDPDAVVERFGPEFENLLHLAMLLASEDGPPEAEAAEMVHEWL